jgi:membrane-bound serine protease (ClpP class)
MVDQYPTDPFIPSLPQLQLPLTNFFFAFLITVAGVLILAKILPKTAFYRELVLAGVNPNPIQPQIIAHQPSQVGKATSALRPSGTVLFNNEPVDVVTQGEFIDHGTDVRILRIEGNKIIVEKA